MSRMVDTLYIHCADTPDGRTLFSGVPSSPGYTTPAMEIDKWHKVRRLKRLPNWRSRQNPHLAAIGYHFVIHLDGTVETGRHLDEVGAHVYGHNAKSIGICLIGSGRYTSEQWVALDTLVEHLRELYPLAKVKGHYQTDAGKTCPNFDVPGWMDSGKPDERHIYTPNLAKEKPHA